MQSLPYALHDGQSESRVMGIGCQQGTDYAKGSMCVVTIWDQHFRSVLNRLLLCWHTTHECETELASSTGFSTVAVWVQGKG